MLKVIGFGLAVTVTVNFLKSAGVEMASTVRIVGGVMIVGSTLMAIQPVVDVINMLADKIGMPQAFLMIVFKLIGIAYLGEFGTNLCKDMGEGAIAEKIDLATKTMMLVTSTPVILGLLGLIADLL